MEKNQKNLSTMSNQELVDYYERFKAFYEAEKSIDYGEFTGEVPEEYYELNSRFEEELEKRAYDIETLYIMRRLNFPNMEAMPEKEQNAFKEYISDVMDDLITDERPEEIFELLMEDQGEEAIPNIMNKWQEVKQEYLNNQE